MTIEETLTQIATIGIVPVVRAANADEAARAVDAVMAGGISIIEITMTVPNAVALISQLVPRYDGQAIIGAGTVLNATQARQCLDAGAAFLVSPGLSIPVLSLARERNMLAIPGALTPSEIMSAIDLGAPLIKIFPCGSMGGPKYLKSLKAPFPNAQFIPTGGVNLANAAEYLASGAYALGVGADLVDLTALRNGDTAKIIDNARQLVEIVQRAGAK